MRREAHRERPGPLRLGQGAVPLAAGGRGRLQRAARTTPRRARPTARSGTRARTWAGAGRGRSACRRRLLLAHRLVEGRAAEDDEPAAVLHELPDRRPGLEREGAAVRQHQHVVVGALQAGRERGRRVDRLDRKTRRAPSPASRRRWPARRPSGSRAHGRARPGEAGTPQPRSRREGGEERSGRRAEERSSRRRESSWYGSVSTPSRAVKPPARGARGGRLQAP